MTTPSSTPTTKTVTAGVKTIPGWTWIVFFVFIIIVFIFSGSGRSKENESEKDRTESSGKTKADTLPNKFTKTYFLEKGKVIRVDIPEGYKCDYFGGGKQYYHQAENCKPEIWGGSNNCPTGLGNPNATYADIWYYNEEITVTCKFSKK